MQNFLKYVLLTLGAVLLVYGLARMLFPNLLKVSQVAITQDLAVIVLGLFVFICGLAFNRK
ncbi:hypothetical protein GCM10009117_26330 [Gangjinia marincola]|uniref:Uncharacterized protein n=1 Tax=Gangjinia marincola TaxID=578463 RepID=A0ABN1MJR8_9FLAO